MNWKGLRLTAATLLCLGVLQAPAFAQPGAVDLNLAPPPLPMEIIPAGTSGSVWIPGYWYWDGGQFKWVSGVWADMRPGYYWVPAQWEHLSSSYHFEPGHWESVQPPRPSPHVVVYQTPPPPPPQPQEVVVEVRPGYEWRPGHWYWDGYQYVWFSGLWMVGPGHREPGGWGGHRWEGPHRWR